MPPRLPAVPVRWTALAQRPRPCPHLPSPARNASWLASLSGFGRPQDGSAAQGQGQDQAGSSSDRLPAGTRVFTQTKVLPFPQTQLFDMVADVDRYSEFLPFCTMSRVVGPAPPLDPPQAQAEPASPAPLAAHRVPTEAPDQQQQQAEQARPAEQSIFTIPPAPEGSVSPMRGPGARRSAPRPSPVTVLLSRLQRASAPAEPAPALAVRDFTGVAPVSAGAAPGPTGPDTPVDHAAAAAGSGGTRRLLADLGIGYGAFKEQYRSLVELTGQEEVRATALPGSNPLFTHLSTTWRLSSASGGTKIEYRLAYGFAHPAHAWVANAVFGRTASVIMRAFEQRAQALYG